MKTENTNKEEGYELTAMTVKAVMDNGEKVDVVKITGTGEVSFVAPSSIIEISQDDGTVDPVSFKFAALGSLSDGMGGGVFAGAMMWSAAPGHFAAPPEGWLVCNGAVLSREAYAGLFAAIGTSYGAGNGSTTFKLPDFMDGNGRFVRAAVSTGEVGTKQDDGIRNMWGAVGKFITRGLGVGGAFYVSNRYGSSAGGSGATTYDEEVRFDASRVVPTSDDNRPYNIKFVPLIKF